MLATADRDVPVGAGDFPELQVALVEIDLGAAETLPPVDLIDRVGAAGKRAGIAELAPGLQLDVGAHPVAEVTFDADPGSIREELDVVIGPAVVLVEEVRVIGQILVTRTELAVHVEHLVLVFLDRDIEDLDFTVFRQRGHDAEHSEQRQPTRQQSPHVLSPSVLAPPHPGSAHG